jgi:putative transposase
MARMPRLALAGLPHLVIQRARPGPVPLAGDADRQRYLDALRTAARDTGVAVHAYALLDDGVLLLVTPQRAPDLGRFMQRVNRSFGPAFHRRHGTRGALWAGRFQATAIEPERYLLPAMLLVEQAPVRAGLAGAARDWAWSSAAHHAGRGASALVTEHAAHWRTGNTPFEREARHDIELQRMLGNETVDGLLAAARGGWPHGSPAFIAGLEPVSARPMQPRPRGRPRKAVSAPGEGI